MDMDDPVKFSRPDIASNLGTEEMWSGSMTPLIALTENDTFILVRPTKHSEGVGR